MNLISQDNKKLISEIIEPIWKEVCIHLPSDRIHHYSMLSTPQIEIFTDSINIYNISKESDLTDISPSYILIQRLSRIQYYIVPFLLTVFRISSYIYKELRYSCIFCTSDHNEVETYKSKLEKYISNSKNDENIVANWPLILRLLDIKPDIIQNYVYEYTSMYSKCTFLLDFLTRDNQQKIDLNTFINILQQKGDDSIKKLASVIKNEFKDFPSTVGLFEYYLFIETIKPHINYITRLLNLEQVIYTNYIAGRRLTSRQTFIICMKYIRSIEYISKQTLDIIFDLK